MKPVSFLVFLTISITLNAQNFPVNSLKFIKESTSHKDLSTEPLSLLERYNLSSFWLWKQENLIGFIGNNYKRFYIHFISIIKNADNPYQYFVYGKTRVGTNICEFLGKFEIIAVYKYKDPMIRALYEEALTQQDTDAIRRFKFERGFILVKYNLYENPKQRGSGLFKGILKTNFAIEGNYIILDTLDLHFSDNFSNNQFVGIWKSYKTGKEKVCNWGLYRVPYSGDLDIGTEEFSPNPKYFKNDWYNYYKAYIKQDSNAIQLEHIRWWNTDK